MNVNRGVNVVGRMHLKAPKVSNANLGNAHAPKSLSCLNSDAFEKAACAKFRPQKSVAFRGFELSDDKKIEKICKYLNDIIPN